MSSHITSFNEIINKEIENRFEVFCNGNNVCNSYCPIGKKISNFSDISFIGDIDKQRSLNYWDEHCEYCPVQQFIEFNREI
jgi:hypothetical protein